MMFVPTCQERIAENHPRAGEPGNVSTSDTMLMRRHKPCAFSIHHIEFQPTSMQSGQVVVLASAQAEGFMEAQIAEVQRYKS